MKYALRRSRWGGGLATEAVAALLAHGHAAHGLAHIVATVAPAHLASQRVLHKAGMRATHLRLNPDGSQTQVFEWWVPGADAAPRRDGR